MTDATWIFLGWEGIMSKRRGIDLQTFRMEDYSIPYGYSPCLLAAHKYRISGSEEEITLRKFLSATARGYEMAHLDPENAANALFTIADHPTLHALGLDFLLEAQQYLSNGRYLVDESGKWGRMTSQRWDDFIKFLSSHDLLGSVTVRVNDLYTNVYIEGVCG
jgi:hypothetical protein